VIHGVLHLLGYDDKTEAGNQKMQDLEERYLQLDDAAA
jgi:ssRNA-specific RNase YbeY (16S rRNA maturation enzyme)